MDIQYPLTSRKRYVVVGKGGGGWGERKERLDGRR
jgi:N-methylhydantoinase B/oxoprolinase/acetone carboxylase alpha subunit